MFTPTEQATPGSTPIMDPLQLQFLSGGQMQYMPQAQFMTPSSYGAFRTMPNPMVNGAPSESGIFHNWMVADRGSALLGLLPEYTINTFNPAVSPVQQQTYAQRRLDDAWSTGMATLGSLGLATTLGGLAMVPGLGLAGLALGMFAPDIAKPVSERIRTTREIQDMSTAKIFSGDDLDTSLGYGFKASRARDLDRFMRAEAADDRIFDSGDYQEMLKLGMTYGQFDYTNSAADYKRILKNMRDIMSTMMQVMGSEDLKDIMENMKRMQSMGLTMEQYSAVARKEQAYSRMTGLSYNDMVETYGKSGALIFQQAGLNPMQGDIQSMANAANMTYLQRTGVLDPVITAKFGGISGLTQELTAQDAKVHRSIKDIILPAMMDDKLEHLRTDIDFNKALKNPTMLLQFMNESAGKIRTQEQWLSYNQHKDKAYAELTKNYDTEMLEMESAKQTGQMAGFKGRKAYEAGLVILGMGTEEAALKTNAYLSEEARATRRRAQEEGDIGKHEELAAKYSPMGKLERTLSKFFTGIGESIFNTFTGNRFDDGHDTRTKAQKDFGGIARPGINQGSPFEKTKQNSDYSGNPIPSLTNLSEEETLKLLNDSGLMTPEESRNYMLSLPNTLAAETGTMDPDQAMAKIDSGGPVGAFQLTLSNISSMFDSKFFKGTDFKERYFGDINFARLAAGELGEKKKVHEDWKKAHLDENFTARANSYVRYNAVHDRLDAASKLYGERMQLLRGNLPAMQMLTSLMNHGSMETAQEFFKSLFNEKTGAFSTVEKVKEALQGHGGLDAAKIMSQTAYDLSYRHSQSGNYVTPYKTDGKSRYDPNSKEAEYKIIEDTYYGRTKNFVGSWDNIFADVALDTATDPAFSNYSQDIKDKPLFGCSTYRPDCSGLAGMVVSRISDLPGSGIAENIKKYTHGNWDTAAGYYKSMKEANGGKDDLTITAAGKTQAQINKEILEKIPVNSFVFVSDPTDERTKGRHASVHHVAMVVQGKDGKRRLVHQYNPKSHLQMPDLEQGITGYHDSRTNSNVGPLLNKAGGDSAIHVIKFSSINKPNTMHIPENPVPHSKFLDDPKALEAAIAENEKARTTLLNTKLEGGGTAMEAHTWENISFRAKDFTESELAKAMSDEDTSGITYTGKELEQALTFKIGDNGVLDIPDLIKGVLRNPATGELAYDFKDPLLGTLSGLDWKEYTLVKPGANATDAEKEKYNKARNLWKAAVASYLYTAGGDKTRSLSAPEFNKLVEDRLNNTNWFRNFQASALQQGDKNKGTVSDGFKEMRERAFKAGMQVSSQVGDEEYQKTANLVFENAYANVAGLRATDFNYFNPKNWASIPQEFVEQVRNNTPHSLFKFNSDVEYMLMGKKGKDSVDSLKSSFNALSSLTNVVGATGKKEGEYYAQAPRLLELYSEYHNSENSKRKYTEEQKKKLKNTLLLAGDTFGIRDKVKLENLLTESNTPTEFMNKFLTLAGVSDPTKNTDAQNLFKITEQLVSPENENSAYKFDLDDFLKKNDFSKFVLEKEKPNSMLLTGDRVRDTLLKLNEFLPGIDVKEFHNKKVVSDTQAAQFYAMAKKHGLEPVAEVLRSARNGSKEVGMLELYQAMERSGVPLGAATAPNGGGAAGNYKAGQDGQVYSGVPTTGLNPPGEMGASGAIFQPETEVAFQRLPIVLERVEKTLADLNNTIGHGQVQPNIK